MNTVRTIELHSQQVGTGKQKFIASSALINGKWYKIKFKKTCIDAPTQHGLYELTIDFDECSIERGKPYTNSKGKERVANDTIWVHHIVGIRRHTEEELRESNREVMSEIFGDEE